MTAEAVRAVPGGTPATTGLAGLNRAGQRPPGRNYSGVGGASAVACPPLARTLKELLMPSSLQCPACDAPLGRPRRDSYVLCTACLHGFQVPADDASDPRTRTRRPFRLGAAVSLLAAVGAKVAAWL